MIPPDLQMRLRATHFFMGRGSPIQRGGLLPFVAVAFLALDEAVHAIEKLGHLSFQRLKTVLMTVHALDDANFGLRQAPDQVGEGADLLVMFGDLNVDSGSSLLLLLHRRRDLRLLLDDELHSPFDIHKPDYSLKMGEMTLLNFPGPSNLGEIGRGYGEETVPRTAFLPQG